MRVDLAEPAARRTNRVAVSVAAAAAAAEHAVACASDLLFSPQPSLQQQQQQQQQQQRAHARVPERSPWRVVSSLASPSASPSTRAIAVTTAAGASATPAAVSAARASPATPAMLTMQRSPGLRPSVHEPLAAAALPPSVANSTSMPDGGGGGSGSTCASAARRELEAVRALSEQASVSVAAPAQPPLDDSLQFLVRSIAEVRSQEAEVARQLEARRRKLEEEELARRKAAEEEARARELEKQKKLEAEKKLQADREAAAKEQAKAAASAAAPTPAAGAAPGASAGGGAGKFSAQVVATVKRRYAAAGRMPDASVLTACVRALSSAALNKQYADALPEDKLPAEIMASKRTFQKWINKLSATPEHINLITNEILKELQRPQSVAGVTLEHLYHLCAARIVMHLTGNDVDTMAVPLIVIVRAVTQTGHASFLDHVLGLVHAQCPATRVEALRELELPQNAQYWVKEGERTVKFVTFYAALMCIAAGPAGPLELWTYMAVCCRRACPSNANIFAVVVDKCGAWLHSTFRGQFVKLLRFARRVLVPIATGAMRSALMTQCELVLDRGVAPQARADWIELLTAFQ